MRKEISPAAVVITLVVVVLMVGVGGYWLFFRPKGEVAANQQIEQMSEQQYERSRPGVPTPRVPGAPGTLPPTR
ncbi:MAG: hypothetical protein NZT92_08305 [Abditibacteriales bacterium]|nr:hypothetical protein [Abditibacteriales bacterium]MDW8365972.1 hypothetical protein [Abditibacteriales bacterium]